MTDIDLFNEEWNRRATDMETELGGIRIGPLKPMGTPVADDESDDNETLRQMEEKLRQKLDHQLTQMKEREASGREYLRKHGVVPNIDVHDGLRTSFARH
jgi:hypothetical protein